MYSSKKLLLSCLFLGLATFMALPSLEANAVVPKNTQSQLGFISVDVGPGYRHGYGWRGRHHYRHWDNWRPYHRGYYYYPYYRHNYYYQPYYYDSYYYRGNPGINFYWR